MRVRRLRRLRRLLDRWWRQTIQQPQLSPLLMVALA